MEKRIRENIQKICDDYTCSGGGGGPEPAINRDRKTRPKKHKSDKIGSKSNQSKAKKKTGDLKLVKKKWGITCTNSGGAVILGDNNGELALRG